VPSNLRLHGLSVYNGQSESRMTPTRLKGHQPFILMALKSGAKTRHGLRKRYERLLHYMGLPVSFAGEDRGWRFHRELDENLEALLRKGFVSADGESFSLTPEGVEVAESAYRRARETEDRYFVAAHSPATASRLSVASYVLLTALKLVAGFTFHSAALIADGLDSLIDVLLASIVLLGVRFGREVMSAAFVVAVMSLVGCGVVYEGMARIARPIIVHAPFEAFLVVAVAGVVSHVLGVYQRRVGKRGGSLALIAQSADNRGHVLQAGAVALALAAARFDFLGLDSVVAIIIGALILRSAVELALEVMHVVRAERAVGDDRTGEFARGFDRHRWNFFKTWTLLTIKEVGSRRDVVLRYDQTFTPDDLPFSSYRSPAAGFDFRKNLDGILEELFEEGLISSVSGALSLTDEGRGRLSASLRRRRLGFFF
jgi:hypothetical protein